MPLRKKHVRWTVALLLVAGVLGPLAALVVYGLWFRGGGYERALKAELESRLRCQATVRGARPGGVGTATVDELILAWEAGGGRLRFVLRNVQAKAGEPAGTWSLTAASGAFDLSGPSPLETLGALNQRLVQADTPIPITGLVVDSLRLSLDTDRLLVTDTVKLEAEVVKKGTVIVSARRLAGPGGAPNEATDATVQLNPSSPDGVFRSMTADVDGVPAREIVLKGAARGARSHAAGTFDLDLNWPAPTKGKSSPRLVEIVGHELSLADWTAGMRGGPVSGTAAFGIAWKKEGEKPATLEIRVASEGGQISAEALQGFAGSSFGWCGAGRLMKGAVPYDSATLTFRSAGDEGHFAGPSDLWGWIPLIDIRLFGRPLPILWAPAATFDAPSVWPRFDAILWGSATPERVQTSDGAARAKAEAKPAAGK